MNVLFLGSGTSTGVPVIGCSCAVCTSDHPRNRRLRSSILVSTETTRILVDSCPDLRLQALRYGLAEIDAIVYTHEHLDHTAGFDELRAFCWHRDGPLPLYAGRGCLSQLRRMYGWAFDASNTYQGYVRPDPHDHEGMPFCIGNVGITPVPVLHGTVETYGYVFRHAGKSFGYVPDVKTLPEASFPLLQGLDILAMDGLCFPPHRTHLTVDENIALMRVLKPRRGILTHSGHRVEYVHTCGYLPSFMTVAYDGMVLSL